MKKIRKNYKKRNDPLQFYLSCDKIFEHFFVAPNQSKNKKGKSMRKINVQAIYDLVILKKDVDAWHLTEASEGMYRSIKIVGLESTEVYYKDEEGNEVVQVGEEIPEKIRAMSARCMQQLYRMTDSNSGRLEKHYGLQMLIQYYLGDIEGTANMKCRSIVDLKDEYLKM